MCMYTYIYIYIYIIRISIDIGDGPVTAAVPLPGDLRGALAVLSGKRSLVYDSIVHSKV